MHINKLLNVVMGCLFATEFPERFGVGGEQNQVIGALLDSAAVSDTWAITHKIHHVTGTGEILTLTPPWPSFAGEVILVPDGAATLGTSGNVAVAVTMVANRPTRLTYNPNTNKWYPDAIA